ncbi:MAG: HemK2/MTQ2 family protein methyltransferase [Nanoarchaeota archaeon]
MDIYEPAEDSYLLQKFVKKYALGRVLDLGTGSGIQALTAITSSNVREVIAVDINIKAVKKLNEEIKEKNLRKIKAFQGDLFENLHGQFNLIIFNPPYLPQDTGIDDPALYGGKKGWELSERFFKEVSKFLLSDGKILFLFSSLTNKEKIEEIIKNNLLQFKQLARKRMPMFEELYVYEVEKTPLLRKLEAKHIEDIHYFAKGRRGMIYTGVIDNSNYVKTHFPLKKDLIKVAIKAKREDSEALERMQNEAKWLKILNKQGIGPRILFSGEDYLVYKFVEGEFILDWLRQHPKEEIKRVIIQTLKQCLILDQLKVNKEEMHHPQKHLIVDNNKVPILLDFERCSYTDKPHNVTQFVEFICRLKDELKNKGWDITVSELRNLAKIYKETLSEESFQKILGCVGLS